MPLVAYMSTADPGRIATISSLPGPDKRRRKKLLPILIEPLYASESMYVRIYVLDCASHEPRGAVVPVELKRLASGVGWEDLGKARCCPLCWRILVAPVGVELPEPLPQPKMKPISAKQKASLQKGRTSQKRIRELGFSSAKELILMLATDGPFTIQEAVEITKISKTATVRHLKDLLVEGKIIIAKRGSAGRGNSTVFEIKAP